MFFSLSPPFSRQEQVTAAITLAMEQQTQKLLADTQLDMGEFDSLLQPIIDTCTKDAISVCEISFDCYMCSLLVGGALYVSDAHFLS